MSVIDSRLALEIGSCKQRGKAADNNKGWNRNVTAYSAPRCSVATNRAIVSRASAAVSAVNSLFHDSSRRDARSCSVPTAFTVASSCFTDASSPLTDRFTSKVAPTTRPAAKAKPAITP